MSELSNHQIANIYNNLQRFNNLELEDFVKESIYNIRHSLPQPQIQPRIHYQQRKPEDVEHPYHFPQFDRSDLPKSKDESDYSWKKLSVKQKILRIVLRVVFFPIIIIYYTIIYPISLIKYKLKKKAYLKERQKVEAERKERQRVEAERRERQRVEEAQREEEIHKISLSEFYSICDRYTDRYKSEILSVIQNNPKSSTYILDIALILAPALANHYRGFSAMAIVSAIILYCRNGLLDKALNK